MTASLPDEDRASPAPSSLRGAIGKLAAANAALLVLSFLTSPLLARFLGPAGRGQVAAVMSVVTVAPWIVEAGLTSFLTREAARSDTALQNLVGSVMPIAIIFSLAAVILAQPVAHTIGQGRPEVVRFIELELYLLPVNVIFTMLVGVITGESQWTRLSFTRALSAVLPAFGFVLLVITHGTLTVSGVCICYLVAQLATGLPLIPTLRRSWPWRLRVPIARAGLSFGFRSWLGTLAALGNGGLDQVLLAGLVPSRELGFYALAVSLSSVGSVLTGAISGAVVPDIARGDLLLVAKSTRVGLFLNAVCALAIAGVAPVIVPIVFGAAFAPMLPILFVLCASSAVQTPCYTLSVALVPAGAPGSVAWAQALGLGFTVPALILVLPVWGAVGAAWVDLTGNVLLLAVLFAAGRRTLRLGVRETFVIQREDLKGVLRAASAISQRARR